MARAKVQPAVVSEPVDGPWALPNEWRWERLGNVAARVAAKHRPGSNSEIVFVGMDAIAPNTMQVSSVEPFSMMRSAASAFEPGDVLYGRLRPYLNKVWHASFVGACSGELLVIRPNADLDAGYLAFTLHSKRFVDFAAGYVSGDRPRIDFAAMADFELPIPPLKTQQLITGCINELFAEVDDGEAALERARGDLATWRKALLKAAVTGELTADWRAANAPTETGADLLARILAERRTRWLADPRNKGKRYVEPEGPNTNQLPEIPEGWTWTNVDQISTRVTKGSSPGWQGFEYLPEGILFIRSQNVGWGKLLLDERVYVDAAFNEVESKAVVSSGDILLNIVGASIGRACKADVRLVGANTNQAVAGIRPVMAGVADFLVSWLISPKGQAAVFENVVETARANLSLEQVRFIPVPLPPASELDEVGDAFQAAANMQAAMLIDVDEQAECAITLRQSILAAAFRGDLVA